MSIYRDTNAPVFFEHPIGVPLNSSVYRDGVKIADFSPVAPVAGRYQLDLTWRETSFDGTLEIIWKGEDGLYPFTREQYVDVVTPLVKLYDMRTLFGNSNLGDADLMELERNVRLTIESYTGQKFGYEKGTKLVTGTGEKRMALPSRLAKLYSVTGGPVTYFNVSADGWYLHLGWKNYLGIKEMPPEDYVDNVTLVSGVIHVPDTYWKKFHRGTTYGIEGEWGYQSVPEDVTEAALLLANDFGTGENLYRDRYLDVIKSGDWNLAFNPDAFKGTGNARADDLLRKYRREGMVII